MAASKPNAGRSASTIAATGNRLAAPAGPARLRSRPQARRVRLGVAAPPAPRLERVAAAHRPNTAPLPIIESAAGHHALHEVAATAGVLRLAVGHIDFMADTGLQCSADEPALAPLRFAVAMTTGLHRLAPAVDGVAVDIGDDTRRVLRVGFGGKLCIHPRQVAAVHAAMRRVSRRSPGRRAWSPPTRHPAAPRCSSTVAWSTPVVLQARRLLARRR